jgi:hypothetical protein
VTCRYIGLFQAVWSILEFPTYKKYPEITRLILHLPYEQSIIFAAGDNAERLQQ